MKKNIFYLALIFTFYGSYSFSQIKDGNYFVYSANTFCALTGIKYSDNTSGLTTEVQLDKNFKSQIWTIKNVRGGYSFKNLETQECIDVYNDSNEEGAEVNTYAETGQNNQVFALEKKGNSYVIKGLSSNLYLSTYDYRRKPGSTIVQRTTTTTDQELWRFTPANAALVPFNNASLTVANSQLNNVSKTYTICPVPARNAESFRMGRFAPADYIPAGIYIKKGTKITIEAAGLNALSEDFIILVGEPNAYWGTKTQNEPYQYILKNGTNNFTSTRNGLLYFNYTNHPLQYYKNNTVQLSITQGGLQSPLFIDNKTSASDWNAQLKSESPYVQAISDKAIITIKKSTFNGHKNTNFNKTFSVLHQVLDASNALAGFDNSSFINTISPLRTHYVEDDISTDADYKNGVYMYAGDIFIGMQTNSVGDLLDAELLKKQWAIWHETGHLFQTDEWTWPEMSEVTVNLFSLNTQQKFGNQSRIYEPDGYEDQSISVLAKKYLESFDRKFLISDKYEMNFICMVLFEQLRKAYGNKFYVNLNQFYRKNPLTLDKISDENFVMQEFMFNCSKISGFSLTIFFQKWGLPISNETISRISALKLPPSKPEILTYFVE